MYDVHVEVYGRTAGTTSRSVDLSSHGTIFITAKSPHDE